MLKNSGVKALLLFFSLMAGVSLTGCGDGDGSAADPSHSSVVSPSVQWVSPASDAQNVPVNSIITIEFSKPMDPVSITGANITVGG